MPLYVHKNLPAASQLAGLLTFGQKTAPQSTHLRLALVNLMPLKEMTELDFFRLLSETDRDVDIDLLHMASHQSKNTSRSHIEEHYSTFSEVRNLSYHGVIITGAPVEKIDFEAVDYWPELTGLMDFTRTHKIPTLYICWAAFAGLYHNYAIEKRIIDTKISGVFPHRILNPSDPLFEGITGEFYIPHSRYATFSRDSIEAHPDLEILSESDDSGVYIVKAAEGLEYYITGHSEYAADTLHFEYHRDLAKGINPSIPANYYPDDNPDAAPVDRWSASARRLFSNWLNTLA